MSQKTKYVVYGALFIAIAVVLGSFLSFYLTENIKISFAPVIVMFAGSVLGPLWGAATGGITDFLSFLIGGKAIGTYFPGMTITMALYGLLAGLLFYRREQNGILRISLSTLLIQTVCSMLLNTFWLSILYGTPYVVLLATRVPSTYISCAIYVVVLCVLVKNKSRIVRGIGEPGLLSGARQATN